MWLAECTILASQQGLSSVEGVSEHNVRHLDREVQPTPETPYILITADN
jgi:predicted MarR family transcription regulator